MDKETLKAATAGRAPRSARQKAKDTNPEVKDTRITDALGEDPGTLTLGGRTFQIGPLTLRDGKKIEKEYGNLRAFLASLLPSGTDAEPELRLEPISFFAWVMLSQQCPDLTQEEVDALLPLQEQALLTILFKLINAAGWLAGNATTPEPATG